MRDPVIEFSENVSFKEKMMWRRVISTLFLSLPEECLEHVPKFRVFTTMVECLSETFDLSHPMVDKLSDRFSRDKVWSFACLQNPNLRKKNLEESDFFNIVVSSSRANLTSDLSPETVILHEIGHFFYFFGKGIPYNVTNQREVEDMCNKFALDEYLRLISMYPQYSTESNDGTLKAIEDMIRNEYLSKRDEMFPSKESLSKSQMIRLSESILGGIQ